MVLKHIGKQHRNMAFRYMRVFVVVICLLASSLSIVSDSTVAYLKTVTGTIENVFVPTVVGASLGEEFVGNYKSNVHVENTGNTEIYVRLMLLPYWVDSKTKKPVAKAAWELNLDNKLQGEYWFQASDGCYYYKYQLPPEDKPETPFKENATESLYSQSLQLRSEADGTHQVLEILAQIIQCGPAVNEAWPAVKVGSDGNLVPAGSAATTEGGTQQ